MADTLKVIICAIVAILCGASVFSFNKLSKTKKELKTAKEEIQNEKKARNVQSSTDKKVIEEIKHTQEKINEHNEKSKASKPVKVSTDTPIDDLIDKLH